MSFFNPLYYIQTNPTSCSITVIDEDTERGIEGSVVTVREPSRFDRQSYARSAENGVADVSIRLKPDGGFMDVEASKAGYRPHFGEVIFLDHADCRGEVFLAPDISLSATQADGDLVPIDCTITIVEQSSVEPIADMFVFLFPTVGKTYGAKTDAAGSAFITVMMDEVRGQFANIGVGGPGYDNLSTRLYLAPKSCVHVISLSSAG